MQKVSGNLDKLKTSLVDGVAHYSFDFSSHELEVNSLIGKKLILKFLDEINCTHCGKKTNKPYSGGYCYPCSIKLPECDMCILKPEQCHYSFGTCRDSSWGDKFCNIPHYIYLANSSGLKVGITRTTQIPTRWIDQGASFALPIFKVGTRHQSGILETLMATEVADKTDWRKMLKGQVEDIDLEAKRDELFEIFGDELDHFDTKFGSGNFEALEDEEVVAIKFPVLEYPEKVTSISLLKKPIIEGILKGIKGQYLIFDSGVINIRSHTGYKIEVEY